MNKITVGLILCFVGVTLIIVGQQLTILGLQRELNYSEEMRWIGNFAPSIEQKIINGTSYYFVSISNSVKFVSENASEATQYALDYTEEWGWVWQK
jgi:uncharacterized membrane protein